MQSETKTSRRLLAIIVIGLVSVIVVAAVTVVFFMLTKPPVDTAIPVDTSKPVVPCTDHNGGLGWT